MNIRNTFLHIGVMSTLLMAACNKGESDTEYTVALINISGKDLSQISAFDGDKLWILPMPLKNGDKATQGPISTAIPPVVELHMVDANGLSKNIQVDLRAVPKTDFEEGTIFLLLETNDIVEVKPVADNDQKQAVALLKLAQPKGQYVVGFVNRTGSDIQNVVAFLGDQRPISGGDVPSRIHLTYSDPLTSSLPPKVNLKWTQGSKPFSVDVNLGGINTNDYSDSTIFFIILNTNTVHVKMVKSEDDKGLIPE